jgi:cold shock CspA family protein/tetratricopeptide (TPR) repeat protein
MVLPTSLVNAVGSGKGVVILGAGASVEAVDPNGKPAPSSKRLAALIVERFLGPESSDLPLAEVSELAINEADLFTVQKFITQLYQKLIPLEAHLTLSRIQWSGLATTNFDLLLENAYQQAKDSRVQNLKPIIQNGDSVTEALRDPNSVPYLKLHGCISRISDPSCPLILSIDQYVQYREGRSRVFQHFIDWGFDRTMIFIGHSLRDSDLRAVLLELERECSSRPRYYVITPEFSKVQARFWESKKITAIQATFSEFIMALDSQLPQHFRTLAQVREAGTPLDRKIRTKNRSFSSQVQSFLEADAQYVTELKPTAVADPRDFYRGKDWGWGSIEQDLDVSRKVADEVIADHLLVDPVARNRMQFVLLKGHAGSGKTVILRRIAWDASRDYDCICLYLSETGQLDAAAVSEIVELCKERVFIFVDEVVDRVHDVDNFANGLGDAVAWVTVIAAARINEWNASCSDIADLVTDEHTIGYLSEAEIDSLLSRLEQHRALGALAPLSLDERHQALRHRYGRQLLVALHEATSGKPFEDIIKDEYDSIRPLSARELYLTVCALNRFGAPVRAGVISRLHGIPFEQFKERFLLPLERVVIHSFMHEEDDYVYRARHPLIAEMVFTTAASSPKSKYQLYSRCLTGFNIDYSSDREAFRCLIRARSLLELFPNHEDIASLLEYATKACPDEAYVYQQRAIYEMNRPSGNLAMAAECLAKAEELEPYDLSVRHSRAELSLRRADEARTVIEMEKHLDAAAASATEIVKQQPRQPYGYHTLCKVYLKRIKLYASDEAYDDMVTQRTVARMERLLNEALQMVPNDAYILDADSSLARILADSARARASLAKAVASDPRSSYPAIRLARIMLSEDKFDEARAVLQKAVDAKPNDKQLHFLLGKLLVEHYPSEHDTVIFHLQRSFSPGDQNYLAQLLFGRALYVAGRIAEAAAFFREQRQRRLPSALSFEPMYEISGIMFSGEIVAKHAGFGFIVRDKTRDLVFFGHHTVGDDEWNAISEGNRVNFGIAFTARGPLAVHVTLI